MSLLSPARDQWYEAKPGGAGILACWQLAGKDACAPRTHRFLLNFMLLGERRAALFAAIRKAASTKSGKIQNCFAEFVRQCGHKKARRIKSFKVMAKAAYRRKTISLITDHDRLQTIVQEMAPMQRRFAETGAERRAVQCAEPCAVDRADGFAENGSDADEFAEEMQRKELSCTNLVQN